MKGLLLTIPGLVKANCDEEPQSPARCRVHHPFTREEHF
jgi:hypothetical protein